MSILTRELADQIEGSEIRYMIDRMTAIRQRDGNPEGIRIRRFGRAAAFCSRTMPWPAFNCVKGLGEEEIPLLPGILDFYEEQGRTPQIEIVPAKTTTALMRRLGELGFAASGFHASFYMKPQLPDFTAEPNIRIRALTSDEFDIYARIHCLGFGLGENGIPAIAANNLVLDQRPGWRFFLGFVDEQPAAAGVMHMEDDVASFTFAATLPEYRSRGLQLALLKQRLREAARSSCRLAVGQAAYLSPSHRNMERLGMKLAYTRVAMTRL
ncbi:GNAT family N-acetyltransferase [Paenibacillus sepulcri]|uniref:GNAT family N-acetyltransferase n=1 Tax=Paenibacillus sepulcri TaxID=359917 RepID=UPI0035EC7115